MVSQLGPGVPGCGAPRRAAASSEAGGQGKEGYLGCYVLVDVYELNDGVTRDACMYEGKLRLG